ncbi:MAG: DUF512 domain-containing protein [Candidatus Eisenbacteria bacterium]|nr:DUF512 domain-containing protein [Candidatus Eisenbacteria bacterium]
MQKAMDRRSERPNDGAPPPGVLVEDVPVSSRAGRAGFRAGDRLLEVNGRPVEDHLDVRFHAALGDWEAVVDREGKRIRVRVPEGPDPLGGLVLEEFRPRTCGNRCIFCFVDQLPPGVRPSLLVKDEDIRLSFLHGNYTTLSTIRDREIERILEQRLSPLYVSVHAVDEEVRALLLGVRPRRPLLPVLERLLAGGIEVWGQVVLCPGINDGPVLEDTVRRLAALHPGFRGVAVVPLGLSGHRREDDRLHPVTPDAARAVLETIDRLRKEIMPRLGTRFVFPADEFLLLTGTPIPPADAYEDFGMLEDGVGMVRDFLDRFDDAVDGVSPGDGPAIRELAVVSGTLFAPVLEPLLRRAERGTGARVFSIPAPNGFLGGGVTVAGLLAGRDVARALAAAGVRGDAAIPAEAISRSVGLFLDDWTPERTAAEAGVERLHILHGPEDLIRLLREGRVSEEGAGSYPA